MTKRIITMTLLFIALVICISLSYYYISGEGEFSKSSYSTARKELISEIDNVFISYRIKWRGIGNPTIKKIEFIRRDGTILEDDSNRIDIKTFIAPKTEIGLLDEESVLDEELNDNFVAVKGYKVRDIFFVMLKVELTNAIADNDVQTMRITYSKYGRTNSQEIPLEEGVISEN